MCVRACVRAETAPALARVYGDWVSLDRVYGDGPGVWGLGIAGLGVWGLGIAEPGIWGLGIAGLGIIARFSSASQPTKFTARYSEVLCNNREFCLLWGH